MRRLAFNGLVAIVAFSVGVGAAKLWQCAWAASEFAQPATALEHPLSFRPTGFWTACGGAGEKSDAVGGGHGTIYMASDGAKLSCGSEQFFSPSAAKRALHRELADVAAIIELRSDLDVGQGGTWRAVVGLSEGGPQQRWAASRGLDPSECQFAILWTDGKSVSVIYGPSLRHVLALEARLAQKVPPVGTR